MTYDDAEQTPVVSASQWARAQALRAITADGRPRSLELLTTQASALAEYLISGVLPTPPPGTTW